MFYAENLPRPRMTNEEIVGFPSKARNSSGRTASLPNWVGRNRLSLWETHVRLDRCGPENFSTGQVALVERRPFEHCSNVPRRVPKAEYTDLHLLGRSEAKYPGKPSPDILEIFPNRYSKRDYLIHFDCAEFTSMCPVTGQPDFAKLRISYVPDGFCVETKSLKFYLASFRHTRSFNEEIANRILEDIVAATKPRRASVHAEFAARGGVSITVDVSFP
jgi:7-cyano-7-deazaguanine reductase